VVSSTLPVWICGALVASLPRCARARLSFPATRKSMRSSKSSGKPLTDRIPTYTKCVCRLLGTPDENIWPGVTSFPDYKSSFPQWARVETEKMVPNLEPSGLDLLDVSLPVSLPRITSLTTLRQCLSTIPLAASRRSKHCSMNTS